MTEGAHRRKNDDQGGDRGVGKKSAATEKEKEGKEDFGLNRLVVNKPGFAARRVSALQDVE